MEKWYHVIIDGKAFGFSAFDGVIQKHPEFAWCGKTLEEYRPFLIKTKAIVAEVKLSAAFLEENYEKEKQGTDTRTGG